MKYLLNSPIHPTNNNLYTRLSHIVIDECHRAAAGSYQAILDHARDISPGVKLLGLSAQP